MKNVFLVLALSLGVLNAHSQEISETPEKWFFGTTIGMNYTNIQTANNPVNVGVDNSAGFSIGFIGAYRFSEALALNLNSATSFHKNELYSTDINSNFQDYIVLPTTIDFGLNATYNFVVNSNKSPYLLLGPVIQIPLSQPEFSNEFGSSTNLALEVGVGCDFKNSRFRFAPELRYAYGLNNVNRNPLIQNVNFHTVRLLINFKSS